MIINICEENISIAWAKAFRAMLSTAERKSPLCVSVQNLSSQSIVEIPGFRTILDSELCANSRFSVKISSEMIFPFKHWMRAKPARDILYEWYLNDYLPRYKALTKRKKKETYFERLIAFNEYNSKGEVQVFNQIESIIQIWEHYRKKGKRPPRSKLQATCFDPFKDIDRTPYLEFPCLQQINFSWNGNKLIINGYYTIQYIFDRAYGNYIGLKHLGEFVAHELGLQLDRINCFVANPVIGNLNIATRKRLAEFTNSFV